MSRTSRRRLVSIALFLALLVLGEWMVFRPVLGVEALARRQLGKGVDNRFVHLTLEFVHTCATGRPACKGLWDPPFFYPEPNVLAFSENLLGVYPIYGLWRSLGVARIPAYTLWAATLAAANFGAFALFARRGLGLRSLPALGAAFLFAFTLPRVNQIDHLQLWAQFPTALALLALALELRRPPEDDRRCYVYAFLAALVWQLYSGLYLSWLTAFVWGLALAAALSIRSTRRALLRSLRSRASAWCLGGAAAVASAAPLLLHQRLAGATIDWPGIEQITLPEPASWLFTGWSSWWYLGTSNWPAFAALDRPWEQALGIGPLTTAVALAGLWRARERPWARVATIAAALAILLVTRWPGGFSLWTGLRSIVPGAESVRSMPRVAFVLLPLAAAGFALAVAALQRRSRRAALLLTALCLLEQGSTAPWINEARTERRSRSLAARLPDDCRAFFYTDSGVAWPDHPARPALDAMWASIESGVPTLNGYSGYRPNAWRLWNNQPESEQERAWLREAVAEWLAVNALDGEGICWLHRTVDERRVGRAFVEKLDGIAAGVRPR